MEKEKSKKNTKKMSGGEYMVFNSWRCLSTALGIMRSENRVREELGLAYFE